ncbi:hypothetical protein TNCV_3841441, partial [Trichonephila clavipes]
TRGLLATDHVIRNHGQVTWTTPDLTPRLFEEARRNTETKHENWKKYYNRRRRDVQIKVSSDNGSLRDESSGFDRVQRRSNDSRDDHELEKKRRVQTDHRERRHNKEDQVDPEKAEKGTIVHTSRSEQDQATRMPDEEVINNFQREVHHKPNFSSKFNAGGTYRHQRKYQRFT